jgi:hypothetical protein
MRRPKDRLAFDQFKNLILAVVKMSRWPEAERSAGRVSEMLTVERKVARVAERDLDEDASAGD